MKIFNYFEGEFDEQIYGNVLLEGEHTLEHYTIESVLAIYPDETGYHELPAGGAHCREIIEKLPTYDLKPEHYATQSAVLHESLTSFTDDDLLWRQAVRETEKLGLPMSFIAYLALLEGGSRVVMWYSRHAAPGWALRQFKRRVRR